MRYQFVRGALLLFTATIVTALGAVGSSAAITISVPTVPVVDAGNTADYTGYGAVNYAYNIAQNDVTAGQYCAFLNAVAGSDPFGIYHPNMANATNGDPGITQAGTPGHYTYSVLGTRVNLPVTEVSFWNATRFANWLNNGQPNAPEGAGTTENGAYDLIDSQMDTDLLNTPNNKNLLTTTSQENNAVVRSTSATWAVASASEWYKAAYYNPLLNGGAGGYTAYATQSNSIDPSMANYTNSDTSSIGAYGITSYYGTLDQAGNVYQWNENIDYGYNVREIRGGAFNSGDPLALDAANSNYEQPFEAYSSIGFRVTELGAVTSVPEPAAMSLVGLAATALLRRRKSAR